MKRQLLHPAAQQARINRVCLEMGGVPIYAKRIGTTYQTVSNWLSGTRPSFSSQARIAHLHARYADIEDVLEVIAELSVMFELAGNHLTDLRLDLLPASAMAPEEVRFRVIRAWRDTYRNSAQPRVAPSNSSSP
jgi:hypothetical protein